MSYDMKDKRDIILAYPWLLSKKLKADFGFTDHDLANMPPHILETRRKYRFSKFTQPKDMLESLQAAWRYLLETDMKLTMSHPRSVTALYSLKGDDLERFHMGCLKERRYYRLALQDHASAKPDLDQWGKQGLTTIAFAIMTYLPDVAKQLSLHPALFHGTGIAYVTNRKPADQDRCLEELIAHVWLRHLCGTQTPEEAKERFVTRHKERHFATRKDFCAAHLSSRLISSQNWDDLLARVAKRFRRELDMRDKMVVQGWSPNAFRQMYPEGDWETCMICGSRHVDLHHLLPRETHSDLTWDHHNVVPIFGGVHDTIHRNRLDPAHARLLETTLQAAMALPPAQHKHLFRPVLQMIHDS